MGRILETTALERGHSIACVVEPFLKGAPPGGGAALYPSLAEALAAGALGAADAALDFTGPASAPRNIEALAAARVPLVEGSTGWHDKLDEARAAVTRAGAALLWSSNFSLGVNLFYRIAAYAARLASPFPDYDAACFEIHHNKKADSPSGTAKTLAETVLVNLDRKRDAVYDKLDRPPLPGELHVASLRVGSAPGLHSLILDSAADTITLTHNARSREGFAAGAVFAAEWLAGKPRQGVFTMDDALADVLGAS
jgi:4-hydroxy-tetrahydrodipicolinate reductase